MRPTRGILTLILTGLCSLALPGCGDREVLTLSEPPVGPTSVVFVEDPASSAASNSTTLTTSKSLTRKDGGELTIGKYKVSIPKLGLSANASVTVTLVNAEYAWIRVTAQSATLTKPMSLKMTNIDETDGARAANLTWCRLVNGAWPTLASLRSGAELTSQSSSLGDFRIGVRQGTSVIQWIRWLDGPG